MKRLPHFLTLALLLLTLLGQPFTARAESVTFTLTAKSAFLRSGPSLSAARVASIFKDQTYTVIARSADGTWLRLDYAGVAEAWVSRSLGTVHGNMSALPVGLGITSGNATLAPATSTGGSGNSARVGNSARAAFTVLAKSAFARSAPSLAGARLASLFKNQTYSVTAISGDGLWLQLDLSGTGGWVLASTGMVKGDVSGLPVIGASPAPPETPLPAPTATAPPLAGDFISVGSRAREIFQRGLALGNDPRVFSKIGDCNSINPYFLTPFDTPKGYQLSGPYMALQDTVSNFYGSFSRESLAAQLGFSPATVLDPTWANARQCRNDENPLGCEYRLRHPSMAFISLGTNSIWQTDADFETGMRRIIETSIEKGVVPILGTKADNLEGDDRFNQIILRLASEYDIPLWNFKQAVAGLPNSGLAADNFHLVWGPPFYLDEASAQTGWQRRNLTALQALTAVWQASR